MASWHLEKWAPVGLLRPLVAKEWNALGPVWEALLGACKIAFPAPLVSMVEPFATTEAGNARIIVPLRVFLKLVCGQMNNPSQ